MESLNLVKRKLNCSPGKAIEEQFEVNNGQTWNSYYGLEFRELQSE